MTTTIDRSGFPNVFDAGLPMIDYTAADNPEDAHAIVREARRQAPIALGPHGPELLTYQLVHAVLRDPRFRVPQGMFLAAQGITSGPLWDRVAANIISLDGDEHQRLRRLVSRAFTPRAVQKLEATVINVITELVERHTADGHCEVVADIARQYPIPVICALLGAPPQDWQAFSDWTDEFFKAFDWDVAPHIPSILAAWDALDAYIDEMVARRRHTLTDDLVSELIRVEDNGDRLSADELRMLVAGLLMAGTDTTRNQLAGSVYALCNHPDQWALLGEHPELARNAVEETMRHTPIAFNMLRTAITDVEIAGVVIPAGTLVIASLGAGNRDPAVYEDPDRLDITRHAPTPMQGFGAGVHYCLGANLARLELAEALRIMAARMPHVRRTGPAPWKGFTSLGGPTTLPIAFDAA